MPAQWVETREIPLSRPDPFPGNARRGNVDEIRKSICANGQYRAIVVRECEDGQLLILAGNHTYDAISDLIARPPTLAELLKGVHPDLLERQTATATALLEQLARGTIRAEIIICTPPRHARSTSRTTGYPTWRWTTPTPWSNCCPTSTATMRAPAGPRKTSTP